MGERIMPISKPFKVALLAAETDTVNLFKIDTNDIVLVPFQSVQALSDQYDESFEVVFVLGAEETACVNEICRRIKIDARLSALPALIGAINAGDIDAIQAFEAGCADILDTTMSAKEIDLRFSKIIFQKHAESELRRAADQARSVTLSAMTESGNLGLALRCIIDFNFCDNVDELGMRLFQALKHYNLNCSLQFRSHFGTKNMEATGLEKELESRLLTELCGKGRFVEFGKRCFINYGQVSLLIKNMPIEDKQRCTAIKDSILPFIQGAEARLKAIDAQRALEVERNFMGKLVTRLHEAMDEFDQGYQYLMRGSATVVEDIAAHTDEAIVFLDLKEEQEEILQKIMQKGVGDINALFAEGIKMNEGFRTLITQINAVFGVDGAGPEASKLLTLASEI